MQFLLSKNVSTKCLSCA